ncbi:alpha/beta-hydrolase [Anaeromyces robustus]|uniref:Alpha/beta-hydrolase n=1 Tax=Anaeromyces robustus TaxID=1754192 RepID=A0A1Y1XSJ0_9FUNG|nr:alpha/beta-hydrolase [Anaeromyces robustus]|eukprot:ORX88274.1 alpha/beta-hydrolase [Anaeromyces robustus]
MTPDINTLPPESLLSRISRKLFSFGNFKGPLLNSEKEFFEQAIEKNKKNAFKLPEKKGHIYSNVVIMEKYDCLRIQKEEKPSEKALLFLFGGGFVYTCDNLSINKATDFGDKSERDVWIPYYPLCIEHRITETYEMVYQTYKEMLKVYKPENIMVLGFSAGGHLALGLGSHINILKENIPMSSLIMVVAPTAVPYTEEENQKLDELNSIDSFIDKKLVQNIMPKMMEKGQPIPDYMKYPQKSDYSNFPEVHLFYSTCEVLYAFADSFEKNLQKYNIKYKIHIVNGAFHCYPFITFLKEGRQGSNEIIEILKSK